MPTHTRWAARVAAGTVLPDQRLLARLAGILATCAERPRDAIPHAAGRWGQAKGRYRFLAHPRVQAAALHQGRSSDTARPCLAQPAVLVVHDTTARNLTGCHGLPDLGPIGSVSAPLLGYPRIGAMGCQTWGPLGPDMWRMVSYSIAPWP